MPDHSTPGAEKRPHLALVSPAVIEVGVRDDDSKEPNIFYWDGLQA
jgi:hypothetical protein